MISIQERELKDTRKNLEQAKQKFYNISFDDAKRFATAMIKEARLKGLNERGGGGGGRWQLSMPSTFP